MKTLVVCAALCVLLQGVVAPPVTANKKEDSKDHEGDGEKKGADWDIGLEYNRYLQEVVQALESDPQFRDKLEKAEVADIRTGKIASELEFVNHNVRSKLDELKRQELERLRHLAIKQYELTKQQEEEQQEHDGSDQGYEHHSNNEISDPGRLRTPHHLDHKNPHSFEIEDLRKLIVQTTRDLEEADRKRREEFKEYEMQKEFEKQQQLNMMDEEHKKEMETKLHEQEEKHKNHPNLHHPGSKQQLEQVWEEQDHMNPEDFNPKTFFHLHDLDGNGFWDADEVKTLFQKELDKMYDPNAPEDDMRERREEMERMREHVFNETDTNRDQLISYQEFLEQTKRQEFDQDPGWEGLDNQKLFSQQEYEEFERRRQAEVQRMIEQGMLPPQPEMHLPYGLQVPPEYLQHHQQQQQQQQHHGQQLPPHAQAPQFHAQGGSPVHPGQMGQYQYQQDPNYHPDPRYPADPLIRQPPQQQQQYHPQPGAPVHQQGVPAHQPQYNQHPNQPPAHHNQPPAHPNQPPVHHNQPPAHPNQPPVHPNQPPVHHNQPPAYQNQPPAHPNQPPVHHNQPPAYQNQPPVHHNQPPAYQNQPPAHPNQPPAHPNQTPEHPNQPPSHSNQPPAHPNQPPAYQNQPAHENQQPPVHSNQAGNNNHHGNDASAGNVASNAVPAAGDAHAQPHHNSQQAHSNEIPRHEAPQGNSV